MSSEISLNSVDADAIYVEGDDIADTKAPQVPIDQRWDERKFSAKRRDSFWNSAAIVVAVVITAGFLAPPFAIYFFGLGG